MSSSRPPILQSTMRPQPLLIGQLLRHGSVVFADSEIVTWTGAGSRRISFGEVGRDAARLAHALGGLGIGRGDRVATFMWNNAEHMTAYLAIPGMGAVLHALNIRLFREQLIYVANHGGATVVLADATLMGLLTPLLGELVHVRHVVVSGAIDQQTREAVTAVPHIEGLHDWTELLAGRPDSLDWPEDLDENDAAGLCYTSGTTGNPKGVAYSHRSNYLHSYASASGLELRPVDRALVVVPMFHANAWGLPYTALITGMSLLMPDRFLQGDHLAAFGEAEGATFGAGVPTIWADMLRTLDDGRGRLPHVRALLIGGSAAPPALVRGYWDRHGIDVLQGWGMTETSPLASTARAPAGVTPEDEAYWPYKYSQGRITAGVELRLVDDAGRIVPWDGESVGEIELRGNWVTAGYLRSGGESEAELADMTAKFDDGWLRTGDVGSVTPDGYVRLTDRAKDVIKSGGEWISSVELENALMAHPQVIEAAVIGVPDERWDERPLAAVVKAPDADVEPAALREFLAGSFAKWQLPERWTFIDEVPKTSVGKFDKKVLRKRYAEHELEVQSL